MQNVQQQLSKWLRPMIQVFSNYGAASASLTKFFKDHSQTAGQDCCRVSSINNFQMPSMNNNIDKGKQSGFNQGSAFYVPSRISSKPRSSAAALVSVVPASTHMAGIMEMMGTTATSSAGAQAGGSNNGKGGLLEILEKKDQGLNNAPKLENDESSCPTTNPAKISRKPWEQSNPSRSSSTSLNVRQLNGPTNIFNANRHQLGMPTNRHGNIGMRKIDVVGPAHLLFKHQEQAQPPAERKSVEETNSLSETNTNMKKHKRRPLPTNDAAYSPGEQKTLQNSKAERANNENSGPTIVEGQGLQLAGGAKKAVRHEQDLLERLRTELPQVRNSLLKFGFRRSSPKSLSALSFRKVLN